MSTSSPFSHLRWPQRTAALCSVVLVLALSWLAVDLGSHHELHVASDSHVGCAHEGHSHGHPVLPDDVPAPCDDPGCVIARFITGATDLLVLALLILMFLLRAVARVATQEMSWAPTRFASHAPSCGPPLGA